MSIPTPLAQGYEFGVIVWSTPFKEGTVLVSSNFCNDCVHPNGDTRLIRLCKKHWDKELKEWAVINNVKLEEVI